MKRRAGDSRAESTTLPRVPSNPSSSQKKQKTASTCHADLIPCFHRTWDYRASSAATGQFVSNWGCRFLLMASGHPRRLSGNGTNFRATVAQHFGGISSGLAVP